MDKKQASPTVLMTPHNPPSVVSPVTFHVFRRDGSRNPDIRYSFISKQHLTAHNAMEGYLTLDDNTMWSLVLEPEVREAFRGKEAVYCIVSYQTRVNGNYAVARLFKEGYKAKGRHST